MAFHCVRILPQSFRCLLVDILLEEVLHETLFFPHCYSPAAHTLQNRVQHDLGRGKQNSGEGLLEGLIAGQLLTARQRFRLCLGNGSGRSFCFLLCAGCAALPPPPCCRSRELILLRALIMCSTPWPTGAMGLLARHSSTIPETNPHSAAMGQRGPVYGVVDVGFGKLRRSCGCVRRCGMPKPSAMWTAAKCLSTFLRAPKPQSDNAKKRERYEFLNFGMV